MRQFVLLTVITATASVWTAWAGDNVWTSLGPDGGSISALVIDPQNTSTVYAATGNGVFKSTDGGASWRAANVGLSTNYVGLPTSVAALAIDPLTTTTLYAAAGRGRGLFKSVDGGNSWNPATSGLPAFIDALAIDPLDPSLVYAGTQRGVYKSTDGGASWNAMNSGLGSVYVNSLAIDPRHPQTIYVGGTDPEGDPPNFQGTTLPNGYPKVFKTTDGAANWSETGALSLPKDVFGIPFLLTDPENPHTVYAGSGAGGVFKSIDGGQNWSRANSGLPNDSLRTLGLAMDSRNPGTLYALMISPGSLIRIISEWRNHPGRLFRTDNGGESWTEVDSGLPEPFFDPVDICSYTCVATKTGLVVDSENGGTVYVGTSSEGVFKTTDAGASWTVASSGLKALRVRLLAVDPRRAGTLYAASFNRIFKSVDAGLSWTAGAWGTPDINVSALAIDPQDPNTIFAGSSGVCENCPDQKLFKSVDGGRNWLDTSLPACDIHRVMIDPQVPTTIFIWDACGIFKTTDGAITWGKLSPGTAPDQFTSSPVFDPQNTSTLYAGGSIFNMRPMLLLLKSTDRGASWRPTAPLGAPSIIMDVAIDPLNRTTIYFGCADGVFKSTDGGGKWEQFSSGMPRSPYVLALLIDPKDPRKLYANTFYGVFRTTDGGASWVAVNSGLPITPVGFPSGPAGTVSSLALDPQQPDTLYAGTLNGIYTITFAP